MNYVYHWSFNSTNFMLEVITKDIHNFFLTYVFANFEIICNVIVN